MYEHKARVVREAGICAFSFQQTNKQNNQTIVINKHLKQKICFMSLRPTGTAFHT